MLVSHIASVENHLLAISQIPENAGHTLHKGTPREAFIREFLEQHLNEKVSIGSGEIIDSNSKPNQSRNQFDIVIFSRDYPKVDFGGGINAFLAESVVATIEVKSKLAKKDMRQAILAARYAKLLQRNIVTSFTAGYIPPCVLSFVVAYDGPSKMKTVYKWVSDVHEEESIIIPHLGVTEEERIKICSPSIDGVFVLGKGFVYFDNSPIGFFSDEERISNPNSKFAIVDTETGSLLYLFLLLLTATSNIQGSWLNPMPYLKSFQVSRIKFVP
jgi:hypothetical protein